MADKYAWLKDVKRQNPEVLKFLKKENQRVKRYLRDTKKLQERLIKEFKNRTAEYYKTLPYRYGNYLYYYEFYEGLNFPVFLRKRGRKKEVLVDWNSLAKGRKFFQPGGISISRDGKYLAFSYDVSGGEDFKLFIKDTETGEIIGEIPKVHWGVFTWNDKNQLIYVVEKEGTKRPYKILLHDLESGKHEEIFREDNDAYFVDILKSLDGYIFADVGNTQTNFSVLLYPYRREFFPAKEGVRYIVLHGEGGFYILTNEDAPNFKVLFLDEKTGDIRVLIEEMEDSPIDNIQVFKDFLALEYRYNGLKSVGIYKGGKIQRIKLKKDEPYSVWLEDNYEYNTPYIRVAFSSLRDPKTIYDYNIKTGKLIKKWVQPVPNYNKNLYETKRLWATSYDGTRVPITIAYHKYKLKRGKNPVLLYGYGSYGDSVDPVFNNFIISLLDRGFIYAIAHVRGGGEFGERWHKEGKFDKKKNTIYDFVECAEHLIIEGLTSKGKIAIMGGSAGGITVGGALNLKPHLFACAVAIVPFVDVLNTMLDPSLPLTVQEYDEWGNPNDKYYYEYIKSYSPYENVKPNKYPPVLAITGLYDPRVGYWEPAKWILKLRENDLVKTPKLLLTEMNAGHMGIPGRYKYMEEIAIRYAFILKNIFGFRIL